MSLANNIEFLRRLPKLNKFSMLGGMMVGPGSRARSGRLLETTGFGTNPGSLRMFSYVPADQRARQKLPLVVILLTMSAWPFGVMERIGGSSLPARPSFTDGHSDQIGTPVNYP